jgi:hypothetical protein
MHYDTALYAWSSWSCAAYVQPGLVLTSTVSYGGGICQAVPIIILKGSSELRGYGWVSVAQVLTILGMNGAAERAG